MHDLYFRIKITLCLSVDLASLSGLWVVLFFVLVLGSITRRRR